MNINFRLFKQALNFLKIRQENLLTQLRFQRIGQRIKRMHGKIKKSVLLNKICKMKEYGKIVIMKSVNKKTESFKSLIRKLFLLERKNVSKVT